MVRQDIYQKEENIFQNLQMKARSQFCLIVSLEASAQMSDKKREKGRPNKTAQKVKVKEN